MLQCAGSCGHGDGIAARRRTEFLEVARAGTAVHRETRTNEHHDAQNPLRAQLALAEAEAGKHKPGQGEEHRIEREMRFLRVVLCEERITRRRQDFQRRRCRIGSRSYRWWSEDKGSFVRQPGHRKCDRAREGIVYGCDRQTVGGRLACSNGDGRRCNRQGEVRGQSDGGRIAGGIVSGIEFSAAGNRCEVCYACRCIAGNADRDSNRRITSVGSQGVGARASDGADSASPACSRQSSGGEASRQSVGNANSASGRPGASIADRNRVGRVRLALEEVACVALCDREIGSQYSDVRGCRIARAAVGSADGSGCVDLSACGHACNVHRECASARRGNRSARQSNASGTRSGCYGTCAASSREAVRRGYDQASRQGIGKGDPS